MRCVELDRLADLPGRAAVEEVSRPGAGRLALRDRLGGSARAARRPTFTIWRTPDPVARAWLVPLTAERRAAILGTWSGSPCGGPAMRSIAQDPLDVRAVRPGAPGGRRSAATARRSSSLTELADPEWQARWTGPGGKRRGGRRAGLRATEPGGLAGGPDSRARASGPCGWTTGAATSMQGLVISGAGAGRAGRPVRSVRPGAGSRRGRDDHDGRRDRGGVGVRLAGADPDPAEPPGREDHRGDLATGRVAPARRPAPEPGRSDRPGLRAVRRRPDRRARHGGLPRAAAHGEPGGRPRPAASGACA